MSSPIHPSHLLAGGALGAAVIGVGASLVLSFPTLGVSPAAPTAGKPFTVDARDVATDLRAPRSYEWDLDHDPTRPDGFERATGGRAVTTTTFARAGDRRVRVRITGADGRSELVERLVTVRR